MAGEPDVVDKLKKGYKAIGRTYKNHIDGYNLLPYLTGKEKKSPRKFFFYFSDDGDMLGIRYDNWKMVFMEQRCHGTLQVWAEPFTRLRLPKIFNLRTDPYEFADITSNTLLRLDAAQRLLHLCGAGGRGEVRGDVQGLPAGAEAEHLHHRRRAGEDARVRFGCILRQRLTGQGGTDDVPPAYRVATLDHALLNHSSHAAAACVHCRSNSANMRGTSGGERRGHERQGSHIDPH